MRFAVSLLTVIAIASVAGTVVQQGQPYASYLNQFGPFWFPAFEAIGLYAVYNAGWFVVILAFLVASVSVCIWRNAPWMLREMRSLREAKREESLRLLPHHAELHFQDGARGGRSARLGLPQSAGLHRQGRRAAARGEGGQREPAGLSASRTARSSRSASAACSIPTCR